MRIAGYIVLGAVVLAVIALLGLELAATSLATRTIRDAVEGHVEVEDIAVTSIARPAVLGLARGELRDVRVTATGVQAGDLRIERVDGHLPAAPIGFGPRSEPLTVLADGRFLEADLERYLVVRSPELAAPTLGISADELQIGDERVPFTLGTTVRIDDAGDIQLVPTLGDPRLWSSLGLELTIEVPRELELLAIEVQEGAVVVTARIEAPPGEDADAVGPAVVAREAAAQPPCRQHVVHAMGEGWTWP